MRFYHLWSLKNITTPCLKEFQLHQAPSRSNTPTSMGTPNFTYMAQNQTPKINYQDKRWSISSEKEKSSSDISMTSWAKNLSRPLKTRTSQDGHLISLQQLGKSTFSPLCTLLMSLFKTLRLKNIRGQQIQKMWSPIQLFLKLTKRLKKCSKLTEKN